MAKDRIQFLCRSCGGVQSRWMGKCPDCGTWDGLERFVEPKAVATEGVALAEDLADELRGSGRGTAAAVPLPEVAAAEVARLETGIGEFDRVLGGGFVEGSVVLLGGDPGIGKSTLLLQAAARLAAAGRKVLYVTSEESAWQTRLRAERLFDADPEEPAGTTAADPAPVLERLANLYILADTNLARITEQARALRPDLCVIDSIQMVYRPDVEASPGSVTQLRRCGTDLVHLAKRTGIAVALVGHVTKEGRLAGPRLLEHLVDVVLSFEGDHHHAHRVVRGIKNRYGTTLEVGLFEMTGRGLRETDAGGVRLDPAAPARPGSVVCPVMHGSRCLTVEIQALTATGFLGSAKRRVSGLDANRLAMLIAVLEQHGGLRLADQDVFASSVGGLRVVEPAADLALCLAIAGAHLRRRIPPGLAAVGEVGLGGEVRPVTRLEQRTREVVRLGYEGLLRAPTGADSEPHLRAVRTVAEALEVLETAPAGARGAHSDRSSENIFEPSGGTKTAES